MPRYFIEVCYKGTNFAGFQVQQNANTIQAEVEKALSIYFRYEFSLTGSSRTDAGVHALQNFFHFDTVLSFDKEALLKAVYHLNAILPEDIVIKEIIEVKADAHCRFDAISREYRYTVYRDKDPFLKDRAYYYPFGVDINLLQQAAAEILNHTDFTAFAKRNTQVHTFNCNILVSRWEEMNNTLIYTVCANRFLRGMVRGLAGTMLKVGTQKISLEQFKKIIEMGDISMVDFSVPAHGLTLMKVMF